MACGCERLEVSYSWAILTGRGEIMRRSAFLSNTNLRPQMERCAECLNSRGRFDRAFKLLKPSRRFGGAELFGPLVPKTGHDDVRREALRQQVRVERAGKCQRRVHVAGFGRALEHQTRRRKVAGRDEVLAAPDQ